MEPNPYETPCETYSHGTIQHPSAALRVFAVIAWAASPLPIGLFFVAILPQVDLKAIWDEFGLYVPTLYGLIFFLPSVGLVLIGAACWGRVRWLRLVLGVAALVPSVAIVANDLIYPLLF
jgi:hypothetical protein